MKSTNSFLAIAFAAILCISCSQENERQMGQSSVFMNISVFFRVVDATGENYLTTAEVDTTAIKMYRIVDGNEVLLPKKFSVIIDPAGNPCIWMDNIEGVNIQNVQKVIHWNEIDRDTITYDAGVIPNNGGLYSVNYRFNNVPFDAGDQYAIHTVRRGISGSN